MSDSFALYDCTNSSEATDESSDDCTGSAAQVEPAAAEQQPSADKVSNVSSLTELLQQHRPNYAALDDRNEKPRAHFEPTTRSSGVLFLNPRSREGVRLILTKSLLHSSGVVCLITMIAFAYDIGFSSPALHDLSQNSGKHTYFNKTIYHDIFNAIGSAGALIGAPSSGLLADYIGRQFTIVLCSIPLNIGWVLILISGGITGPLFHPTLFVGRFVVGVAAGGIMMTTPLYLAEISPKNVRGLIVILYQLILCLGILIPQALGIKLHYVWLSVAALSMLAVLVPLFVLMKESPRWLVSNGKFIQASRVLSWLRGRNVDVEPELDEIKALFFNEEKLTVSHLIRAFTTRPVFHPMVLSILLVFIQQFNGIKPVMYNGQFIFEQAGVKNAATLTAIVIGGVPCLCSIPMAILINVLGKKVFLISGSIMMCLSMVALSVQDLLKNEPYCHPPDDPKCIDNLQPLAVTALIIYIIGGTAWAVIPLLMASELLPLRVRGFGVGIVAWFYWLFTMVVLLSFGSYQDAVKPWGAFLSFAIVNIIAVLFVIVFIPETKGKFLEEIEQLFNPHQSQYISL